MRLILPRKEFGDKSIVPSLVCSIWAATLLARLCVLRRGCTHIENPLTTDGVHVCMYVRAHESVCERV